MDLDRLVLVVMRSRCGSGDPAAAGGELRPAYEALRKLGEKSHFSSLAHALANAAYAQGRYDGSRAAHTRV